MNKDFIHIHFKFHALDSVLHVFGFYVLSIEGKQTPSDKTIDFPRYLKRGVLEVSCSLIRLLNAFFCFFFLRFRFLFFGYYSY